MSAAPAKEAGPVKASAGGRSPLLLGLVGVNVLLVLAFGGYVAFTMMAPSASAHDSGEHEDDGEHEEDGEHEGDEEGDEEHAGATHEVGPLVEFESMVVNLTDSDRHYLKVTFQLELREEADVEHAEHVMPALRDAVLAHLSSLGTADVRGRENVDALKGHLLDLAKQVVGRRRVRRLYLTELLVQ